MTALAVATPREAIEGVPASLVTRFQEFPAGVTHAYNGSLVMLDLADGYVYVCPTGAAGIAKGHCPILGICRGSRKKTDDSIDSDCDNSAGSAGDRIMLVEAGIFEFANDGTTALAQAHYGQPCFASDDATVGADPLDYNRPQAGIFLGLGKKSNLPRVRVGMDPGPTRFARFLANADLSALKNTTVNVVSSSGVGKVDSDATNTAAVLGQLINAPTSGQLAIVAVDGPAPGLTSAAGYTCGQELMVTTGGCLIAATTGKVIAATALETATANQTRMVWVAKRQLA